ncbi:MAG TPA: hypothetical protein VII69_09655 [Candidatus Eremiobacteraceae bacterium]
MVTRTPIRALSTAVALVFLVGCSNGSAIAPKPSVPQGHARTLMGRIPVVLSPIGMLRVNFNSGQRFMDFNRCPPAGPIEYISDFNDNVIDIYKGNFAGQTPCGRLTSGLLNPQGMFVKESTHELYVANTNDHDVVVFRRGATSPFKTYIDSTAGGQLPVDVTVAKDGTVMATNIVDVGFNVGSLSTWHKDGAFVGNFPNPNGALDYFLTVQKDGTVYFDDNTPNLYKGSCPAGACGSFVATGAKFVFPGGVRSADGDDVVLQDQEGAGGGDVLTYEPPDFGSPTSCAIGAGDPVSFDINRTQHHYFYTDAPNNIAVEIDYPSCALIGTVPGNTSGVLVGVARDEPETL